MDCTLPVFLEYSRIPACAADMCTEFLGDDCMDTNSDQHNVSSLSWVKPHSTMDSD